METIELVAGSKMASCRLLVCSQVLPHSHLVVNVAWEIPIELTAAPGDTGARCLSDQVETVLICLLEKERCVIAAKLPAAYIKGVGSAIEVARFRVLEVAKVVVVAMDDN